MIEAKKYRIYGKYWEYTKFQIRYMAIERAKELSKEKRMRQDRILKGIISIFGKNEQSQADINTVFELQAELDSIYQNLAQGAFIRSRRKWIEHGERNTKYFHNLEKRNVSVNSIYKLKINDQISEDPSKILILWKIFI